MASSALFFFLLITLILHTHARDSQLFNKVTSTSTVATNNAVPKPRTNPQEQEPNFLPETENGYGLYGHETVQQTPATASTNNIPYNKHLPKNYNPVSYVTEPENINDIDNTEFTDEKSYSTYYNNDQQQPDQQQEQETEQETEFRSYRPTTTNTATNTATTKSNNNNEFYYNGGGSSFNSRPRGRSSNTGYRANNNNGVQFEAQGMSDTRFLENGKYHFDINSGRYNKNHPYETMKGVRTSNENAINKNYYTNNNNEYNNGNSEYQNQDEFQGVDDEIYNDLP